MRLTETTENFKTGPQFQKEEVLSEIHPSLFSNAKFYFPLHSIMLFFPAILGQERILNTSIRRCWCLRLTVLFTTFSRLLASILLFCLSNPMWQAWGASHILNHWKCKETNMTLLINQQGLYLEPDILSEAPGSLPASYAQDKLECFGLNFKQETRSIIRLVFQGPTHVGYVLSKHFKF